MHYSKFCTASLGVFARKWWTFKTNYLSNVVETGQTCHAKHKLCLSNLSEKQKKCVHFDVISMGGIFVVTMYC